MAFLSQNILIIAIVLMFITIILAKTHHDESSRFFSIVIILFMMGILVLFTINDMYLTLMIVLGYLIYIITMGKIKYYDLKVRTKYIESDYLTNNFRALFLADFQFDKYKTGINQRGMNQVIKKINNQEYDMLLFGGDYINYPENIDEFFEHLAKLNKPRLGGYAILGNHDYIDYEKVKNGFINLGYVVVDNDRFDLSEEVSIAGVEDMWHGTPVLPHLRDDSLNILLSHNPDFIRSLPPKNKVDFMLAGHYHAGQVNLLGIPIQRLFTKYVYGFYNDYHTKLYVSSGLGGSIFKNIFTIQMRFFAQPEIVEVVFIGNKK